MDLFSIFRVIFGYILILFVPGFAITWAIYPEKEEIPFIERIALSTILSIAGTMISILFMDVVLGVDLTPVTITVMLLLVTGVSSLVWWIHRFIRRKYHTRMKKKELRKFIHNSLFGDEEI